MQDVNNLINTLRSIVDSGHSVIVVEHNPQVLRSADWILEMGPGAGINGGSIVGTGSPLALRKQGTLTSKFIFPDTRSSSNSPKRYSQKVSIINETFPLSVQEKTILQNLDLNIPHGQFVVVTGPSGSGKSSLAFDIIFAEGQRRFGIYECLCQAIRRANEQTQCRLHRRYATNCCN